METLQNTASPAEVAETLRNVLANKGIAMKEASTILGLQTTSFSKIVRAMETTGEYMSKKNAARIAEAFGMNAEFLAHGWGAPLQNGDDPRSGQLFLRQSISPQRESQQWGTRYTFTRDKSVELAFPPEQLARLVAHFRLDKEAGVRIWTSEADDLVHIAAPFSAEQLGQINAALLGS